MAPNPATETTAFPQLEDAPRIENWDEYWMEMAVTAARKSKDPRCRVGAVIVQNNQIVSTGFNGLARQVYDDPDLLADIDEKLNWICHAEQNAILNAARVGSPLRGAKIYVTKFPCLACCNAIIQAGITEVETHDKKFWDDDPADSDHSRKKSILKQAGIKVSAPFHPAYEPKRVTGKRPVAPVKAAEATTPPVLATVPSQDRRKLKAAKSSKSSKRDKAENRQQGLWPAGRTVRGGKSG